MFDLTRCTRSTKLYACHADGRLIEWFDPRTRQLRTYTETPAYYYVATYRMAGQGGRVLAIIYSDLCANTADAMADLERREESFPEVVRRLNADHAKNREEFAA